MRKRKIFVKKQIDPNTIKKELKTKSIVNLAKEYGYNKDYFRLELKKLDIYSPRLPGHRIFKKDNVICVCGNQKMSGRNICKECRNKRRRDLRKEKEIKLAKLF